MASRCANGNVYMHSQHNILGQWVIRKNITDVLHAYLKRNDWLESYMKLPTEMKREKSSKSKKFKSIVASTLHHTLKTNINVHKYLYRKHLLYAETICWCSAFLNCLTCLKETDIDNISYNSYYYTYVQCKHRYVPFLTVSKNGHIFIWMVAIIFTDNEHTDVELIHHWDGQLKNPVSSAWYQIGSRIGKFIPKKQIHAQIQQKD